jgi:hypothetical protein
VAVRCYFHSSGTSPLPSLAFDSEWEQTGQAVRLPMDAKSFLSVPTALANSTAVTVPITTTQQILVSQNVSMQIFKPIRIVTTDWVACVMRGFENAATTNVSLAMRVRAVSSVDGRELGGVFASSMQALTELATTAATRLIGNNTSTIACTSVSITEPWRLVFELGLHANGPTAGGSATLRPGCNAASDFAFTSALTTDLNPWFEISRNLDALGSGFQHLRGFVIG